MRRFAQIGNRDKNEPEFTEYLRAAQIPHRLMAAGVGADILILMSPMWFCEIKNPAVPQWERSLTPGELDLQAQIAKRRG